MNSVSILGRLVRDPELRFTNNGKANTRFTVAVQKGKDGADFINCVAWERNAELIAEYFKKGQPIGVHGRLSTGSYEKDGRTVYTTDVIVDRFDFINFGNNQNQQQGNKQRNNNQSNFMNEADEIFGVNDEVDESFPF